MTTYRCEACGHASTTMIDGTCELCGGVVELVALTEQTAQVRRRPVLSDAYHLPNRPLDEIASSVLDLLFANGGGIEGEPGYVLLRIAEELNTNYFGVAVAVRQLEGHGFIAVSRTSGDVSYQGNKIDGIHVV